MVIGADGSVRGHFERTDEVVQVSSDKNGTVTAWVEGVDAQMLPINDDFIIPPDERLDDIVEPQLEDLESSESRESNFQAESDASYARFKTGDATIRILLYYEDTFTAVSTVADYLVELTNFAFEQSQVSASLEIAALKPVSFESPVLVASVLGAMTTNASPFENIESDLVNEGADMAATLVVSSDPEEYAAGIAYLGSQFNTQRFSVTRYYGDYESGEPLYPSYTFAHEIGHNLGANHNREQYENNGQDRSYTFSYAFGYLIEGVQRTIMSYASGTAYDPRILRFSHPDVSYNGYATGISTSNDDSAFVARAFENNRHVAADNQQFSFDQVSYESVLLEGYECGNFRLMQFINNSSSTIELESQHYVRPDGSVVSYALNEPVEPGRGRWTGYCGSELESNPLGTIYTESFFRYFHPISGEIVEGPRFQWSETYIPQSELRIAYADGGKPIGNTHRMMKVGDEVDIAFEADRGFSLGKISSTCEGSSLSDGYRVTATTDPCLLEASFSDDRTPPAAPTITGFSVGDGSVSIAVDIPNDGGADITSFAAECSYGDSTYYGQSTTSPVLVSGLLNGETYRCSAKGTNQKGTGPASFAVTVVLPQTLPVTPLIERVDYDDGEILIFVSSSNQPTTVDSYLATCTDGTNTFTGASATSRITVSGLKNDVAHTCTVRVKNSVGTSSASAKTDPITPEALPTGLPIWLLYEATK